MPRLYKKEKLCSQIMIDRLFSPRAHKATDAIPGDGDKSDHTPQATLTFPLRCVWIENPGRRCDAPVQFLISIPKRRLRHAVDRVTMRRRVREAYRLNRDSYPLPEGVRIDMALIYVDSRLQPYSAVERAVKNILKRISAAVQPTEI